MNPLRTPKEANTTFQVSAPATALKAPILHINSDPPSSVPRPKPSHIESLPTALPSFASQTPLDHLQDSISLDANGIQITPARTLATTGGIMPTAKVEPIVLNISDFLMV